MEHILWHSVDQALNKYKYHQYIILILHEFVCTKHVYPFKTNFKSNFAILK